MLFDWLLHPERTRENRQRYASAQEVNREADDLIDEIRQAINSLQETAGDERKGYPIASALKRRRPTDE